MNNNSLQDERPGPDRFLIAIVAGIALLVIVALVFGLRSPAEAEYSAGNEPQDIAYNYLLAIQREEYERAYGYVYSDLDGYPTDFNQFRTDVARFRDWDCQENDESRSISYEINEDRPVSTIGDLAIVNMSQETFYRNRSIFNPSSSYSRDFEMELINTDDGWKLVDSEHCWNSFWVTPENDSQGGQEGGQEI